MLIELEKDAALVLFELLAARQQEITSVLRLQPPERNALWSLECALEKVLTEPLSPDYEALLAAARKSLVERGGE